MTQAVLDQDMLQGLKTLLGDKFTQLVDAYISDGEARLQRLQSALETTDLGVIKDEAHGIKGSSRNIGANPLAEICEDIEAQARKGDATDMEQKISAVQQGFAAVCRELQALIQS